MNDQYLSSQARELLYDLETLDNIDIQKEFGIKLDKDGVWLPKDLCIFGLLGWFKGYRGSEDDLKKFESFANWLECVLGICDGRNDIEGRE